MIRIMVKIIKKKIISLTMICKILLKFDKKKKKIQNNQRARKMLNNQNTIRHAKSYNNIGA